jgi:hypothetical protein
MFQCLSLIFPAKILLKDRKSAVVEFPSVNKIFHTQIPDQDSSKERTKT